MASSLRAVSLALLFLFSFSLVVAVGIDNPYIPIVKQTSSSINISTLNVNNSQYFRSYTPSTLWTYYTGLGNALWCELTGCTMSGDIDMGGNDITGVSRIMNEYPIGGGYIDVSSDPIVITGADLRAESNMDLMGSLYIDDDLTVGGNIDVSNDNYIEVGAFTGLIIKAGRILAENGLGTNRGILAIKTIDDWSSHLKIFNENFNLEKQGNNGIYDFNNNMFCDYVYNNFTASDAQKPKKVIILTSGDYVSATARISEIVNSSCVVLALNPAWDIDLPNVTWIERAGMVTNFAAGEAYDFVVGNDNRAFFKVGSVNNTAPQTVFFNDVSGANQHHGVSLDYQMENYEGQVGMSIDMKAGISQLVDKTITALRLTGDANQMNNSNGVFIDMNIVGRPVNGASTIDGINMPSEITNLIKVGSPDLSNLSVFNQAADISSTVTVVGDTTQIFTNDNDVLYIGSKDNFTSMAITLSTPSSTTIKPLYYYCDSSGTWQSLGSVVSGTNGFTKSGTITFTNPTDRGVCNQQLDGTPFSDTDDYTYIAIQRTRNNIVTKPVLDLVATSGATNNMFLRQDILRLSPEDTAPEICTPLILGAIYYDISEDDMCVCKTTGWRVMTDGSACT